jgi:hypothetical protein
VSSEVIYPSRKEAIKNGGKFYHGKSCKFGHIERSVSNGCIACRKVIDKAYNESPKGKAAKKAYKQTAKGKASNKAYNESPKGKAVSKAATKTYDKSPKRKACRERPEYKAVKKAYSESPKGKASHTIATRKNQLKRQNVEGSYTTQEWLALKEQHGNICLCCKRHQSELDRVLEQDHVVPITKGGTNWITNIQPLCHDCNGMGGKGTKTIDYR